MIYMIYMVITWYVPWYLCFAHSELKIWPKRRTFFLKTRQISQKNNNNNKIGFRWTYGSCLSPIWPYMQHSYPTEIKYFVMFYWLSPIFWLVDKTIMRKTPVELLVMFIKTLNWRPWIINILNFERDVCSFMMQTSRNHT